MEDNEPAAVAIVLEQAGRWVQKHAALLLCEQTDLDCLDGLFDDTTLHLSVSYNGERAS